MTNTKIDLNTVVDAALGTIVNKWSGSTLNEKQEMMKVLLLHPEQFPIKNGNDSYSEWNHANIDNEKIRSEMKDILLDVLYEYAGEYAQRVRPDGKGNGDMEQYEDLMAKFWSDVPQSVKGNILFGDCLVFSLYSPKVVTSMESKTKHGDNDALTFAMNKIMNHHEEKNL